MIYAGVIAASIRGIKADNVPVREDWLWDVILPMVAYGALCVGALLIWGRPEQSLYGFAAVSILLLFIGVHNAWDVAVWNSMKKQRAPR